tara:strand:+ start:307 stop:537 length:231 start_codon:yes stop_codon:yes gene_type:complete
MDVALKECGANKITIKYDDNYEIVFLNEEGKEVAIASSILNRVLFSLIRCDENNIRRNPYQLSVKLVNETEEVVEV